MNTNPWPFATGAIAYAAEERLVRRVLSTVRRIIADGAAFEYAREASEHAARHFLRLGPGSHPLWCVAGFYANPERSAP